MAQKMGNTTTFVALICATCRNPPPAFPPHAGADVDSCQGYRTSPNVDSCQGYRTRRVIGQIII